MSRVLVPVLIVCGFIALALVPITFAQPVNPELQEENERLEKEYELLKQKEHELKKENERLKAEHELLKQKELELKKELELRKKELERPQ